jgi:hypothetical protein
MLASRLSFVVGFREAIVPAGYVRLVMSPGDLVARSAVTALKTVGE